MRLFVCRVDEYMQQKERNVTYGDIARFAMHYWKRRPGLGFGAVGLLMTATIIDAFVPVYSGKVIDALTGHLPGEEEALKAALRYLAVFVGIGLAFNLLRWASLTLWARFAVANLKEIVTETMAKVQRFSADWHANAFAGATVRKITRGMWSFDMFEDTWFMGLMPSLLIMVSMTVMLLVQLPLVGVFVAVMIVIYCAVSIWLTVFVQAPLWQAAAKADTEVGATLADTVTAISTVKAFGSERREDERFGKVTECWYGRTRKAWLVSEIGNFIRGTLRMVMMGGMVGITTLMWRAGQATPGDITLALTSFFIVGGYLRDIGMHIVHLQKAVSDMEDAVAFWMREDDIRDAPDAKALVIGQNGQGPGEIVFDNVRFAYDPAQPPIYEDLSLQIAPGEKVALVGHSGSGKTTLVKLVQRLYDVQGGEVRIDGQNVAHVTQESLRSEVALVPQEPVLFHRSLAENIAYGKPDASMDEIVDAAKKAYAHEFITGLSEGYETLVGERGVKLSGGERQRVAIARAILADAPILILDEATSALDSVSEHYIQMALASLMEGRTTITIAHRLATIRDADRILVFDKGQIVEQGTHAQLVERKRSRYRRLYQMQALSLAGEDTQMERAAE